jgi:hypothetical protein
MQPSRSGLGAVAVRLSICGVVGLAIVTLVSWDAFGGNYSTINSARLSSRVSPPSRHPQRDRILIYITTHMSAAHVTFLQRCWPSLLAKSQLYRQADVTMLVTKVNKSHINVTLLNEIFAGTNFRVHVRPNPGYQAGAILGMKEAYERDWFKNYAWVIRVNPDVLIRNDSILLERFLNPKAHAVFVDCHDGGRQCPPENGRLEWGPGNCTEKRLIHTDFLAFRPSSIDKFAFKHASHNNAEQQATQAFSSIIMKGNDSWLPDVGPLSGCRVSGDRSPVLHIHDINAVYPACLSWYDPKKGAG